MLLKPTLRTALASVLVIIAVACGSGAASPAVTEPTVSTNAIPTTEFDVDSFAALNPNPQIRELDLEIDLGFYERDRIPRDAIEPIYTPKFVSPEEASLRSDEIVMGLVINGDARAYPTGLLRVREMVNDEIGGTPVLVSW
jgi:hypothetical protein